MSRILDMPIIGQLDSLLTTLSNVSQRDDAKLKALQEISDHFEALTATLAYPSLMDNLLKTFIKILQTETMPQYIGENNTQQLRKLMLEMIHRMPLNSEHWKQYVKTVLGTMFKLMEVENEENSLVCLRIIIEFHKQFRPPFSHDIQQFLRFVKRVFENFISPANFANMFESRPHLKVNEIQELNIESALQTAYVVTPIQTEQKLSDGTSVVYTLLPRGVQSLKVLAELPISIILFHQVYKQSVQTDMLEFIQLIMSCLNRLPTQQQIEDPNFNRELLVDFLAIQVKAASFFAVLCRTMPECMANVQSNLVQSVTNILNVCPPEVSLIRKDLLVAVRHLLATDLRTKFISCLTCFFDDKLMLGTSFTAYENLRQFCWSISYSTIADLVHHSRTQLNLQSQSASVHYFSRVLFDSTLPCTIHNMSAKLLLNLIEGLCKQADVAVSKEMIGYMLDIFVMKFKEFSTEILPALFEKCERRRSDSIAQPSNNDAVAAAVVAKPSVDTSCVQPAVVASSSSMTDSQNSLFSESAETKESESMSDQKTFILPSSSTEKEEKLPFGMPMPCYLPSVNDCRNLVKMLVYGAKTISWGLSGCRFSAQDPNYQATMLSPKECACFIKIVKYGLMSLDVYTIIPGTTANTYQRAAANAGVRSKDEKEVMDHFAGIFSLMNIQTFKEIFSTCVDYLVDRISENHALQLIPNSFLGGNGHTSATFGSILIGFLVKRMHLMGSNLELSNLYLKLFKLVYGSVSLFPSENEQMLRPYLHRLVNDCVEYAISTKEPYNYLMLLRGLFRSIGGGSHDVLYQEFLPVLPGLLKNLNALQSCYHQPLIRELIVELCLTVPVRLSSLVPHIPMLMEPLVLALNGTSALVLQGLRTLELCIDNLQPEFLHEHMGSVRSNLMHALWNIVCSSGGGTDQAALTAWRTIGKLGELNRKVLTDKQKLEFCPVDESAGPNISLKVFGENGVELNLEFSVLSAIRTAFLTLKKTTTDLKQRTHAMKLLNTFLLSISAPSNLATLPDITKFIDGFENFGEFLSTSSFECDDDVRREACVDAIAGLLFAATNKETRQEALGMVNSLLRHLTFVAILEQINHESIRQTSKRFLMDAGILIEAIAKTLADEGKEICKAGILAMTLVFDTAAGLLKSKEKVCQLRFVQVLCRKISELCYHSAWYGKMGGCVGIKFFLENLPPSYVVGHMAMFFSALVFVVQELSVEIANGTVEFAKNTVDILLKIIANLSDDANAEDVYRTIFSIITRHLCSSFVAVRELAVNVVETVSKVANRPISQLLEYQIKNLMQWMSFDELNSMHSSPQCQIGTLEGVAYICRRDLPLSVFDPSKETEQKYFDFLVSLLDSERLVNIPSNISEKEAELLLVKLKQSALKALLGYKRSGKHVEPLFTAIFKALTCDCKEIQDVAYDTMNDLAQSAPPPSELFLNSAKSMLVALSSHNGVTLKIMKKLLMLTKLFPSSFTERLCDQLFSQLTKWLEVAAQNPLAKPTLSFLSTEMEICSHIVEIFQYVPSATSRFVDSLIPLLTKAETALQIGPGCPWRKSLLNFLIRYPAQTVDYFFLEHNLKETYVCNYMLWLLKQEEAKSCRDILQSNPLLLANLISGNVLVQPAQPFQASTQILKETLELLGLRLINILLKRDRQWLVNNLQIVQCVRQLWLNPDFRDVYHLDSFQNTKHKSSIYTLKILLTYFESDTSQIEILFEILRCFAWKKAVDLSFIRKFLDKEVSQNFPVEWKRKAFFKFVEINSDPVQDPYFKTSILQYVIIPCVARSFEKGETEQLIGGPPTPEIDSDDNIISVFMLKVIASADPQKLNRLNDVLIICLYELTSLFVEYASTHIHDGSKKQGSRLRTVMMFGWPCLQLNTFLDPIAKYYGHLLIAHIINKFAINRKIVLQVFHSLLKAHQQETRHVVRQALNILTPAVPLRMEDGQIQLAQLIKKTFIEEGYSLQQVMHLLQLLTRHYKVFFPVRHQLMQYIIPAMQKVALQSAAIENRRLAVDVCEMIIKWEMFRLKGDLDLTDITGLSLSGASSSNSLASSEVPRVSVDDMNKPIEKAHMDSVVNFLIRLACSPQEQNQTNHQAVGAVSSSTTLPAPLEAFSKRCLYLVRVVLKPDMWGLSAELKVQWVEKVLSSVDQSTNISAVCVCLDVLSFVVAALPIVQVLPTIRPLQRGLVACLNSSHSQMVKSMYNFMSKLLTTNASILDDLDLLNACVQKILTDTLMNFEKTPSANISSLGSALMLLKALCNANPFFIDRISTIFVKVMQKLASTPINSDPAKGSDMLAVCLDLVRGRVESFTSDVRKQFVTGVLCTILEKSTNAKIVISVVKLMDDWMKNSSASSNVFSVSFRERQTVLARLLQCIEKRFSSDQEVTKVFLELVYSIFKNEQLRGSELHTQLHGALVMGLSCWEPPLREKYSIMFNEMVEKKLYSRLFYIMCSLRWDFVAQHYWIKQCIELTLNVVDQTQQLKITASPCFFDLSNVQGERCESSMSVPSRFSFSAEESMMTGDSVSADVVCSKSQNLSLWQKEMHLMQQSASLRVSDFLPHFIYLCCHNTELAENVWIDLLPSVWKNLTEVEKSKLTNEVVPFLSSKYHAKQTEAHPSAIKTFVEAFSACSPSISIKPQLLRYLGKSHGLWHKSLLLLENSLSTFNFLVNRSDILDEERQETLDCLGDLFVALNENDLWVATWLKRSRFPETNVILAYEQQGMYLPAVDCLEKAMAREQNELTSLGMNLNIFNEFRLWEDRWLKCMQELNHWDVIKDFSAVKTINDPFLLLESAWRIPNWPLMKDAIFQIEHACPNNYLWKLQLYRGYWTLCSGEEQHVGPAVIERIADIANQNLIKEWRKLPKIVSRCHFPLLQAAQQVVELSEASHLASTLLPANVNRTSNITDMKSIVKTWRNRSPTAADSLSHWSQIFTWRLLHYQNLITCLENDPLTVQNAVLGVHAFAQCMLQFSRVARRQGLTPLAIDALNRLHTIHNLPVVDGFQKLREQIKCCLKIAATSTKTSESQQLLHDAIDIIENTNISYFPKDTSGEFYALKGVVLSRLDRNEDAAQAFSASLQMADGLCRPWGYWGDHLENIFMKEKHKNLNYALNSITCYLQASRLCTHETKSRKYVSKILWLLKFDVSEPYVLHDALTKFASILQPMVWLSWIPQLFSHLKETCRPAVVNLLIRIGKAFPEACFYSIKFFDPFCSYGLEDSLSVGGHLSETPTIGFGGLGRSSIVRRRSRSIEHVNTFPPWQKCFRDVFAAVREAHPFLIATLSKTCAELASFYPKHWSSTNYQTVQQILADCYKYAFENRNEVQTSLVPPHLIQKLKVVNDILTTASSQDDEAAALLKTFELDFDLASNPTIRRLQPFMAKLVKWAKTFDARSSLLPKTELLPNVSQFLSCFASRAVVVDVPSENFSGKQPIHFRLKIAKFVPKIELVRRGSWLCRRIWIRGTNGKKFGFLVLSTSDLNVDPLKLWRLLQFKRLLNSVLTKNKECATRLLQFSIPTLIPIGSNMLLVSDEPSSLSLTDVLRELNRNNVSSNELIMRYFDKLVVQQTRGQITHQNLRECLKDIQSTMLPKNSLSLYFNSIYPNAESYFTFRKQFCLHMALINIAEYGFLLSTLSADQVTFDKESGFVSATFLRLDINEMTGELECSRPVQFRLTPCLVDFFGFALNGQIAPAMIAVARCLHSANIQHWLRMFLYDEYFEWSNFQNRSTAVSTVSDETYVRVLKAIVAITIKIQSLASFDNAESKVTTLLAATQSLDNLCRMEPSWHPWL